MALLMFYESRFVCKFVGPQTPKNCNNIWQMFPFCCSPPSLCSTPALSNCANSPNSWVLCAFLCYYYAMLSCASSHSPQRKLPVFNLANGRRLLHAAGVAPANPKYGFQIPYPIYPQRPCSSLSPCHPFVCTVSQSVGHFSLCKPTLLIFSHSATKSNNNKLEMCAQNCCPTCLYPRKKLKKKR